MSDEEDINIIKDYSNKSNSEPMSVLNENTSTYMGVKTIPEGTIPDTNQKTKTKIYKNKNKNKKSNKKKYNKKNNKKEYSFSYSSSSSSLSSSSSYSSYISSSYYSLSESRNSSAKKISFKEKKNIKNENKIPKNKKVKKNKTKEDKNSENSENSENEENEENEEKSSYELKVEEIKEEIKKDEIDTKFEWDEGGNVVYVTGSFCEWNKFYLMNKNDEGKYSITIPLPRGFHQYKFKVDDVWTYSKKQPKFEDNGNVNNCIDTTDYDEYDNLKEEKKEEVLKVEKPVEKEKSKPKMKEKIKSIKKEKSRENSKDKDKDKEKNNKKEKKDKSNLKVTEEEVKVKRNSCKHDIHFLRAESHYTIYYPLRAELNEKPSSLPGLYKTYYILNEEENKNKKERKFSQIEYIDNSNKKSNSKNQNDINHYVKFQNLYHIHSNHLHSKDVNQKKNTITSIISRYRFKFSTFIYYKENKPKTELGKKKYSKTVRIKRAKKEKIKNDG